MREEVRVALGEEALADAAGVIAIFSAVVKVADGIGIPLEDFKADVLARDSARNWASANLRGTRPAAPSCIPGRL